MSRPAPDDAAVSPVIATVLLVAVVVVLSTTVVVLTNGFRDSVKAPAPSLALVSDGSEMTASSWKMRLHNALPPRELSLYLVTFTTAHNGTLVARPAPDLSGSTHDFYWQLGASAGAGLHNDNASTVGVDGLGGFHLRIMDIDDDGRLGGGDRLTVWYDGDGDQGHQEAADEPFPDGTYRIELKHLPSDTLVAYLVRHF